MKNELLVKVVKLDNEYRKKWNIIETDFIQLYNGDTKISDTLYRIGGFGAKNTDGYFMLLKHTEAMYDDSITTDENRKHHLESTWCILTEDGTEKVNSKQFEHIYLQGGVIYSKNSDYYNIETGEFYGHSNNSIKTTDFIFLDLSYNSDKEKRGCMKINKFDGTYELFKN